MNADDRVVSFSTRLEDEKGRAEIRLLKAHCRANNLVFSQLVIQGIALKNKELGLK